MNLTLLSTRLHADVGGQGDIQRGFISEPSASGIAPSDPNVTAGR
jgi:hypothetical protein